MSERESSGSGKFDNKSSELSDEFKLFNAFNKLESVLVLAVVEVEPVPALAVEVELVPDVVEFELLFELVLWFARAGLSATSNGLIPFFIMEASNESSSKLYNVSSELSDDELEPSNESNNVDCIFCCIVSMLCKREDDKLLEEEVLVLVVFVPLEFVAEVLEPVLDVFEPLLDVLEPVSAVAVLPV